LIDFEDIGRESLVVVACSGLCAYAIRSIYTIESSLLRDPLFLSFRSSSPFSRIALSDDLSLGLSCVAIAIVAYRLGTSINVTCDMD
jgi:hypothetical protein